jgi:hypothetical protein
VSILDRTQVVPFDAGSVVMGVLDEPERIRLTVEARAAALDAAARLVAAGRLRPGRAPVALAEEFERWILRDEPQDPE